MSGGPVGIPQSLVVRRISRARSTCERRAEAVLLASFSYILKRLETASAELTFDRVTGEEKEKISREATHGDLGLPSEGRLGLPYCQTRCLFR